MAKIRILTIDDSALMRLVPASCVVFGMPKEAIKLGAAETVRPLNNIAATILNHVIRA